MVTKDTTDQEGNPETIPKQITRYEYDLLLMVNEEREFIGRERIERLDIADIEMFNKSALFDSLPEFVEKVKAYA